MGTRFDPILLTLLAIAWFSSSADCADQPKWDASRYHQLQWPQISHSNIDSYSPQHKIGASGIAFEPATGTLLISCEKHPHVLQYLPGSSEPPRLIELPIREDVDIEAISLCEGMVYLCDEDELVLYAFLLSEPQTVRRIRLGPLNIDSKTINGNAADRSSLEGLVVVSDYAGPGSLTDSAVKGPIFYLLDEHDRSEGQSVAKIHVARQAGEELVSVCPPVNFKLKDSHERLTELFVHDRQFYAIRSYYVHGDLSKSNYEIVRCDLEAGTLTPVFNFLQAARKMEGLRYHSNFEGAAVDSTGKLYVISDNENEPRREGRHPLKASRGTALISFPGSEE